MSDRSDSTQPPAMKYDCIIVLCGGIVRTPDGQYAPSRYEDSDPFGMLGGHMRIIAAALLYLDGQTDAFVFSAGKSEKMKAELGRDIPAEAHIYQQNFAQLVGELTANSEGAGRLPRMLTEHSSTNTVGSIRNCLELISKHGWHTVAFVTANLHLPRARALSELAMNTAPANVQLTFLGAEDIVKALRPGEYDQQIDAAHASPAAHKRARSEAQGLEGIQSGSYVMSEFQLHQKG